MLHSWSTQDHYQQNKCTAQHIETSEFGDESISSSQRDVIGLKAKRSNLSHNSKNISLTHICVIQNYIFRFFKVSFTSAWHMFRGVTWEKFLQAQHFLAACKWNDFKWNDKSFVSYLKFIHKHIWQYDPKYIATYQLSSHICIVLQIAQRRGVWTEWKSNNLLHVSHPSQEQTTVCNIFVFYYNTLLQTLLDTNILPVMVSLVIWVSFGRYTCSLKALRWCTEHHRQDIAIGILKTFLFRYSPK